MADTGNSAYEIKSFRGGISDYNDKGIAGSAKFVSAANIRSKDDNLSCNQALKAEGLLSGGEYIFEDLILWFVAAPDNCIYGFGDTGRVYKRTAGGEWSKVYTDPNGKITGAALWYQVVDQDPVTQIAHYEPHLFWATATRLNHKKIPGIDDWSDVNETITAVLPSNSTDEETGDITYDTQTVTQEYPKTNLDDTNWHTMKEATGALVIVNNDKLAIVNAEDNGYSPEITENKFSIGQEAVSLVERDGTAVIATSSAVSNTTSVLYSWVYGDKWQQDHQLEAKEINAIIDSEYMLLVANGQLWFSDMYQDLPICDFPGGGRCKPGGVGVLQNVALFAMDNCVRQSADSLIACNGIYGYGRRRNADSPCLTLEYPVLCEEMGGLLVNGGTLLVACKTIENEQNVYKVMTLDHGHKQICEYESLELSYPYVSPVGAMVGARVILNCRPIPDGCSVEVYYRHDLQGGWIKARFQDNIEAQNDNLDKLVTGTEGIFLLGDITKTTEVKLVLTPSGNTTPEVESIHLEFYGNL
jgi:hypothetical protein